jgi:6-phosphogluconolactonase
LFSRRRFLASTSSAGAGLALATALPAWVAEQSAAPSTGYISVRRDNRIAIFRMDPRSGKVTWQQQVEVEGGPDPMVFDPRGRFLYVACRDSRQLASYRIDPATGGLSLIGAVPVKGEAVQIVTDRTGRYILSAFFYESTVTVHRADDRGQIDPAPADTRTTAYGCHGVEVDPSNRFLFVPHVARSGGPNGITQFRFDAGSGRLTPNTPPFLALSGNEGPRHLLVHPTLSAAYSSDEQGCSATAYQLNRQAGTLTKLHSVSTVEGDGSGFVTCSEILIHPNGKLLFVNSRTHDNIASFHIDPGTGRLSAAHRVQTEPDVRPLGLDPTGRFLAAAGSGGTAGRLATYEVNADTGTMTPLETCDVGNGPMWILMKRG